MTGLVSIVSVSQRSSSVYGRSRSDGVGDGIYATIAERPRRVRRAWATLPPDVATQRFPIRFGARSRPLLRLFGVRGPADAWVELRDDELEARFGRARVVTPISNIAGYRMAGPWLWITAIGFRRGLRGDITFGGSHHGGVRLNFRERVRIGPFQTSDLYVTVDDIDGFAAALGELGILGVDGRKRKVP